MDASVIEYHPTIKDLPTTERPRERLIRYGAGALSSTELLAIALGSGGRGLNVLELSSSLLARYDGLLGLARASCSELCQIKGMGPAKVAQVKAALELGRRLLLTTPEARPQVRSPADAAGLLMAEMGMLEKEHLRTLLLDTKNHVLASPTIYVGSINTSLIRVAEIFREAI